MTLTAGDLTQIKDWLESNIDQVRQFISDNELLEQQTVKTQFDADIQVALDWFNTLGISIQTATTRTEALDNFNQIETLLQTETDSFRLTVLRKKLQEANEKFMERKRNG